MIRVRVVSTGVAGSPYYTNLHFGGGVADAQASVTAVRTFINAIAQYQNGALVTRIEPEVSVIDIETGQPTDTVITTPGTITARGGAEALPWATQGLVRLRTNFFIAGRRLQGRMFLPAMVEAQSTNGVPATDVINTVNAAATALIGSAENSLVIYSRTARAAAGVATASMWNQWSVLRSRRD